MKPAIVTTPAAEEWKDVKGFEGKYQVSNLGRVRSLDRTSVDKAGRIHHTKGMILKDSPNNEKGYYRVSLSDGHRNYTHYEVHRLVALHFVPGYKEGLVVNHKNEIKTDNRAENLEWCTYQYNLNYSDVIAWKRKPVYQYDMKGNFIAKHRCCADVEKMMGTYQGAMVHVMYESKTKIWKGYRWSFDPKSIEEWKEIARKYKTSRRMVAQLTDDRTQIATFSSLKEAADNVGVTSSAIYHCCNGDTLRAGKYKWEYI